MSNWVNWIVKEIAMAKEKEALGGKIDIRCKAMK